jgi:hypothetical protein
MQTWMKNCVLGPMLLTGGIMLASASSRLGVTAGIIGILLVVIGERLIGSSDPASQDGKGQRWDLRYKWDVQSRRADLNITVDCDMETEFVLESTPAAFGAEPEANDFGDESIDDLAYVQGVYRTLPLTDNGYPSAEWMASIPVRHARTIMLWCFDQKQKQTERTEADDVD